MLSTPQEIYQGYWVAQCRYTRSEEQFSGLMTLAGNSEEQAIGIMRQYFTENSGQYSFAEYDTLMSLIAYVESSEQLELPLLRQVLQQQDTNISAVLVDEHNLTHPLPSEKGDIHYQEGQPEFLEHTHLYAVIDSGEYHRQMGQHLVPMLHGTQLPWKSLYQGETQDSLEDRAPYFVQISSSRAGQRFLEHCLSLPNKETIGFFINSIKPFADVHRQMRKMTYLRNQSLGSWNFFRFYDVSHFIPFIESLTQGQLLNIVSGVKAFYGYNAKYAEGVEITFHKDYLYDTRYREALFISERLYRHYGQLTLMQTLDKAKPLIQSVDATLMNEDNDDGDVLDRFCLRAANQSFLAGTTQMQALIYSLLGRYLTRDDMAIWYTACEYAKPYQHNQVLFSYHRYIYCLEAQGVSA